MCQTEASKSSYEKNHIPVILNLSDAAFSCIPPRKIVYYSLQWSPTLLLNESIS